MWQENDKKYVSTAAEKQVIKSIMTKGCVTIVGNSGTGKSFLSRHVALKMKEQGYMIIPCDNPEDIRNWFKHGRKTVFVFDDVCGRYTLNQQIFIEWKQRLEHIQFLLDDNCCKVMCTCRLNVYKNEQFSSLSILKTCLINLSSDEFRPDASEKFALAKMYFKENADKITELSEKYDFFPLLCSLYHNQKLERHVNISDFFSNPFQNFENELVELYADGKTGRMTYCSLVLCVLFNNTLTEETFSTIDKEKGSAIKAALFECELEEGTPAKSLKKSLDKLEGTFVVKEDSTYKILHDKLFDFLAKYFGEKMLQLFIDHANYDFMRERFIWPTTDNIGKDIDFAIRILDKEINRYIDRLLIDWKNGFVLKVFANRNMNSLKFRKQFTDYLDQLDQSKKETFACVQDINSKDTALVGCSYNGFVELVKWLINHKREINYSTEKGNCPLFWASQEGHVNVVLELLQHSAQVNQYNMNRISPLYIASYQGHFDIVQNLLRYSAKVNQHDSIGASPLYIASQQGHADVVRELIQHSANINSVMNNGASPLLIASQQGHGNAVNELLKHSAKVNTLMNNGASPLLMACQNGHTNVVKKLLVCSASVNTYSNDGNSPLSRAAYYNRVEVVKLLLQCKGVDINRCDIGGRSSLHWAIQQGHDDVVKELLKHSTDVNTSEFKGKKTCDIL